jgi:hypothetical protein
VIGLPGISDRLAGIGDRLAPERVSGFAGIRNTLIVLQNLYANQIPAGVTGTPEAVAAYGNA